MVPRFLAFKNFQRRFVCTGARRETLIIFTRRARGSDSYTVRTIETERREVLTDAVQRGVMSPRRDQRYGTILRRRLMTVERSTD